MSKKYDNIEIRHSKSVYRLANALVASVVVALLLAAGCLAFAGRAAHNEMLLEYSYQRSLYHITDNVENMESKLSKIIISTDAEESAVIAHEIWRQSDSTAANLAELPTDDFSIRQTSKFVNQVGEYCFFIAKKLTNGEKLSEDELTTLETMQTRARLATLNLKDLLMRVNDGQRLGGSRSIISPRKATRYNEFDEMEKHSVDYPKIIFDGPFSDGTEVREYEFLSSLDEVSPQEAEATLKKFFQDRDINLEFKGESGGDITCYEFAISENKKGGGFRMYAQITKKGGLPLMIDADRNVDSLVLSQEAAAEIAEKTAAQLGFGDNLRAVWFNEIDNVGYVNLAPLVENTRIYTDLVKVKIALDDGQVLGIESTAYCCNHKPNRDFNAEITKSVAQATLSDRLSVKSGRKAVIPKGRKEILAYEFECEYNGMDYFVYINAQSGKQADLQRVIDSAQGKMLQ